MASYTRPRPGTPGSDDFPHLPEATERKITNWLGQHVNALHLKATLKSMDALVGEAMAEVSPIQIPVVDKYNATSGQTDFVLSGEPQQLNNITMDINGVVQHPGINYELVGPKLLRTNSATVDGDFVQIKYGKVLPIGEVEVAQVLGLEGRLSALENADNAVLPISMDDVTDLATTLDSKQDAGDYAAAAHTHIVSEISGLQQALDSKQNSGSYAQAEHTHSVGDISGLGTQLAALGRVDSIVAGANITIDSTDPKNPIVSSSASGGGGTVTIPDVEGLELALSAKQPLGSYAAAVHSHNISDVTNLQTSLDTKAPAAGSGVTQLAGNFTLTPAASGRFLQSTSGTASVITIPPHSSAAWSLSASSAPQFEGAQLGAGAVTISPAPGVSLFKNSRYSNTTAGQYSVWGLKMIAQDQWLLFGDLGAA